MSPSERSCSRSARLAWVLLVLLAVPVLTGAAARLLIHFSADFSGDGYKGPDDIFEAEGGKLVELGPDHVFEQGQDGSGDGVLQVLPNPSTTPAQLVAELDEPAVASTLYFDLDLQVLGSWSPLVIWLNDSDGGGMIDVTMDDPDPGEPPLRVDDVPVALPPMAPGDELHLRLTLRQPGLGLPTWTAILSSDQGSTTTMGPLATGGKPLSIGSLVFVRPAMSHGGSYAIDDVIVSSPAGSLISDF